MSIYYDAKKNKIKEGNPPACDQCGSNKKTFYEEVEVNGKSLNYCFECTESKDFK